MFLSFLYRKNVLQGTSFLSRYLREGREARQTRMDELMKLVVLNTHKYSAIH